MCTLFTTTNFDCKYGNSSILLIEKGKNDHLLNNYSHFAEITFPVQTSVNSLSSLHMIVDSFR